MTPPLSPRQFSVNVDFILGHDWSQPGTHRVSVLAHSEHEAHQVAAQMVASTHDAMPTRTTTVV